MPIKQYNGSYILNNKLKNTNEIFIPKGFTKLNTLFKPGKYVSLSQSHKINNFTGHYKI